MITAANTCVATITGILGAGATPVLADVDAETWTLDPASAEAAITERTRALVPVHLYGQCADLDAARRAGARARAEARRGRRPGARRRVPAGSAPGRSAMRRPTASTRRRTWARSATPAPSSPPTPELARARCAGCAPTASGPRRAGSPSCPGVNSRLDEVQAEVLLRRLARLDAGNDRRRRAGRALPRRARGSRPAGRGDRTASMPGTCSSCWPTSATPSAPGCASAASRRSSTTPSRSTASRRTPTWPGGCRCRSRERLCERVVSLPLYPELTDAEAEQVVAAVRAG